MHGDGCDYSRPCDSRVESRRDEPSGIWTYSRLKCGLLRFPAYNRGEPRLEPHELKSSIRSKDVIESRKFSYLFQATRAETAVIGEKMRDKAHTFWLLLKDPGDSATMTFCIKIGSQQSLTLSSAATTIVPSNRHHHHHHHHHYHHHLGCVVDAPVSASDRLDERFWAGRYADASLTNYGACRSLSIELVRSPDNPNEPTNRRSNGGVQHSSNSADVSVSMPKKERSSDFQWKRRGYSLKSYITGLGAVCWHGQMLQEQSDHRRRRERGALLALCVCVCVPRWWACTRFHLAANSSLRRTKAALYASLLLYSYLWTHLAKTASSCHAVARKITETAIMFRPTTIDGILEFRFVYTSNFNWFLTDFIVLY